MPSGLLSLTDEKLTQLKEQIIRILKSCDEQSLELHVFKKVYKDTYGKRFEVHFRELKSKKLKDVMEKLDYVTVLEQSGNGIIQIKLKDQVEDSSSVPGRVNSFSSTYSEESISLVYNTTQGPPMSLVAAAAFEGTGCRMQVTPAPTVAGESGITLPSHSLHEIYMDQQQEMSANKDQSLPPTGYERLVNEMGTANIGKPVNSFLQLSATTVGTSGPFETSLHHTNRASGLLLLSDKKLIELKNQVTRILNLCDGQCLELQRFKKAYKDTFGRRFLVNYRQLKYTKLENIMAALDDVILLEKSGKKIIMKLKDQAEQNYMNKESDSAGSSTTAVGSRDANEDSMIRPSVGVDTEISTR